MFWIAPDSRVAGAGGARRLLAAGRGSARKAGSARHEFGDRAFRQGLVMRFGGITATNNVSAAEAPARAPYA
jgi:hypothetical protein